MDQRTIQVFFSLLRSAVCGTRLTEEERAEYAHELLPNLLKTAAKHDMAHLLAYGLTQNALLPEDHDGLERCVFTAVYRYERIRYEYENLCGAMENAQIPFLPLKGSVMRAYYPEPWMRTSCDIDVLVRREDLEKALSCLVHDRHCILKERATHDVSLLTQTGILVELHFDLVEEGQAKAAAAVLSTVWEHTVLRENSAYWHEMTDPYFYFYHIAHMAKHFEVGGCGIRPFVDLWILDRSENGARDPLLAQGGLLAFAEATRKLSQAWFGAGVMDDFLEQMQAFILQGGVYGTADNRVALHQAGSGGKIGYLLGRVFIPFAKLKRYYPILEKYPWLMPFMQVRRWFMLLKPDIAKMAKRELTVNGNLEKEKAQEMKALRKRIGL